VTLEVGLTLEVSVAGVTVTKLGLTISFTRYAGTRWVDGSSDADTARAAIASSTSLTIITWVGVEIVDTTLTNNTEVIGA
jgi:hypothetical protein